MAQVTNDLPGSAFRVWHVLPETRWTRSLIVFVGKWSNGHISQVLLLFCEREPCGDVAKAVDSFIGRWPFWTTHY